MPDTQYNTTDAPTVEVGEASTSDIGARFDLIPPCSLKRVAEVFDFGAKKYGDTNWYSLPASDHYNHILGHLTAWKAGDESEDHLGHALCRIMMLIQRDEWDKGPGTEPRASLQSLLQTLRKES